MYACRCALFMSDSDLIKRTASIFEVPAAQTAWHSMVAINTLVGSAQAGHINSLLTQYNFI
jgi:hypothetical protein